MIYQKLSDFLRCTPAHVQTVTLSHSQIEVILQFALPASARDHRQWWENQKSGKRPQAESWMKSGFKVDKVDLAKEWVKFIRI